MANKLYVGNLPFSFTDEDLRKLFEEVGSVASARVITDRDTGRSKGFGFVEMATDGDAQKAIQQLNQSECNGRPITVNEARPREEGGGGSSRGGRRDGGYSRGYDNRGDFRG